MMLAVEEENAFSMCFRHYDFNNSADTTITTLVWNKVSKEYVRMSKYMRKYCAARKENKVVDYTFTKNDSVSVERFSIHATDNNGVMNVVIGSVNYNMEMCLMSHSEMMEALEMYKDRVLACTDPKCIYTREELDVMGSQMCELLVTLSACSNLYQVKMTVDKFYVYIPGVNGKGAMVYICAN